MSLQVRVEGFEAPALPLLVGTVESIIRYSDTYCRIIKIEAYWNGGCMAEREGFEPSKGVKAFTPLAGERLQPLGHLSGERILYWNYFK
jgi:hypothetical protein